MAALARLFDWKNVLVVVKPDTLRPGLRRRLFHAQYRSEPTTVPADDRLRFHDDEDNSPSQSRFCATAPKTRGRHSRAASVSPNDGGRRAAAEERRDILKS